MGGRKIYLFATRGSFVSLPLVPPPHPVAAPGYRGAARCRGGLRAQRLRGTLAAHPAEPGDRVPRAAALHGSAPQEPAGRQGNGAGRAGTRPAGPQTKSGPAGSGCPWAGRARARSLAGRKLRGPKTAAPPLSAGGKRAQRERQLSLPQEPSAAPDESWYRRKAACSALSVGLARGTEPAGRHGPAAQTANFVGRRAAAASPAGGTGAAARSDPRVRPGPAPVCRAPLCPALPRAVAVWPDAVRSRECPQRSQHSPGLRFVPRAPRPVQCGLAGRPSDWWAQRAGNNTALGR